MLKQKTLNIRKFKPQIEEIVEQKLYDILGDPDEGLKLKDSVKKKLASIEKKQCKEINAKKAADELGLKW